jgi:hypothetical protein
MYRFRWIPVVSREAHCFLDPDSRNLPETFGSLGSHTDAAGGHRRIAHDVSFAGSDQIVDWFR